MIEVLLYLLSNAFSIYVYSRFARIFFKDRIVSKLSLFLSYVGYYVINSGMFLLYHNPYLNLLTTIVPILLITFEYKSKIFLKFVFTTLVVVTVGLIDSIIVNMLGKLSIVFSHDLAISLICFIIELLVENIINFKSVDDIKISHLISILIVPLGSLIILIINKNQQSFIVITQSIILLLINFMIFFFYDLITKTYEEKFKLQLTEQKNKEYVHQIELNNKIQEQVIYLRHDMNNHLQRMEIMLKNKDYQELHQYLNKCIETNQCTKPISNCGNVDIDSLLNYKLGKISNEVPMDIKINLPNKLQIDTFDLTIVLGNLLDNSIEALKLCQNKYLSIIMNYDKGVLFIEIKNSYTGHILTNGKRLNTTKTDMDNHGIGLQSVQNTLNNYDGKISYTYNENIFQVKVILFDRISSATKIKI